jgi:hypothetical protein
MAAFFSKTFASAGNRKTFTISTWLKITNLSNSQSIFYGDTAGSTNGTNDDFYYSSNKITFGGYNSVYITSTAVFRDVSAWYHVVLSVDTTQATSANRIKLYVNGVEQARTEGAGYPAQNFDTAFIKSGAFQICGNSPASGYGLFNLANFNYVDGTALDATSFGETDATTGIWKPKSYSGSYGTNGFFLKFENSASLGTDSSGNGNNWTVNNTPTQTVDTPSNVFCTLNALDINAITLTQGNLLAGSTGATWKSTRSTFGVSKGKWYWEMKATASASSYDCQMGVGLFSLAIASFAEWSSANPSVVYTAGSGEKILNGTASAYGATYTVGDIIGVAFDADNLTVTFYKNGTSQGVITTGWSADTYAVEIALYGRSGGTTSGSFNFGNGYFETTAISSPYSDSAGLGKFQYAVPSGYYALCTKNINVYG